MKKIQLVVLLVVAMGFVSAENNIEKMFPKDLYRNRVVIEQHQKSGTDIGFRLERIKINDLKNMQPYELPEFLKNYFEENREITSKDLKKFLKGDEKFVLQLGDLNLVDLYSYRKIYRGKEPVGEYHFTAGIGPDLSVGGGFVYSLSYIDKDEIVRFFVNTGYLNKEMDVLESLPEIFYKKDGKWYWRSEEAMVELCKMMENHDERLPVEMLELQLKWEEIIGNLEVNGKKITLK